MFTRKLALSGTVAGIAVAAVLVTASVAQQPSPTPGPMPTPQAQAPSASPPLPQPGAQAPQPLPPGASQPSARAPQPQPQPQPQVQSQVPNPFDDDDDLDDDDQGPQQGARRDGAPSDFSLDRQGGREWAPRYGQDDGQRWRDRRDFDRGDNDRSRSWGDRRAWREEGGSAPSWRDGRGYGFGGEGRGYGPGGEGRRFGFDEGRGPSLGGGQGFGPGAHMHHGGMRMGCGPHAGMFVERMLRRLERVTQPGEQQRAAFDKLRQAAEQAQQKVQESCPTERPVSPPSRLAMAEKRLDGVLDAVRIIRPAMDEYWGTLSEEQKARYYARQGFAQRWRERMFEGRGMRHGEGRGFRDESGRGWRDMGRRGDNEYRGRDRDDSRSDRMRGPRDTDGDGWPNSWGGRL